jgi:hypothetical protein
MAGKGETLFKNENVKSILADYGYEDLEPILTEAKAGQTERLEAIFDLLKDYVKTDFEAEDVAIREMTASTAETINELNRLLEEGLIGDKFGKEDEETAYEK